MSKNGNSEKRQTEDEGRSLVEWITLGISVLILLVVAGLIVYEEARVESRPAALVVEPLFDELRQERGQYYLPVQISNSGSRTAEGVEVQMRLAGNGMEMETASLGTDFLAGGASMQGVVIFSRRPTPEDLSYVGSFVEP